MAYNTKQGIVLIKDKTIELGLELSFLLLVTHIAIGQLEKVE
jgi:hypothetical protein